jgi:hypothetical protein
MRAVVLETKGSPIVLKEIPDPLPQAGDAVLEVIAVPVLSYAKHVFSGALPYPTLLPLVPGITICVLHYINTQVFHASVAYIPLDLERFPLGQDNWSTLNALSAQGIIPVQSCFKVSLQQKTMADKNYNLTGETAHGLKRSLSPSKMSIQFQKHFSNDIQLRS